MSPDASEYIPGADGHHLLAAQKGGYFWAARFPDMPELVRTNRNALVLAYIISYRARWNPDSFNPHNLAMGEAAIDYETWGLTEQEFKTARNKLKTWNFATFRATSKGTVGKLIDTRLFSVLNSRRNEQANEPTNKPPTSEQRASNEPPTTNEERKSMNSQIANSSKGLACAADSTGCLPDWNGLSVEQKMLAILGKDEVAKPWPDWISRAGTNPDRMSVIMDAMHSDIAVGRVIKNRGGYAETLWKIAK